MDVILIVYIVMPMEELTILPVVLFLIKRSSKQLIHFIIDLIVLSVFNFLEENPH